MASGRHVLLSPELKPNQPHRADVHKLLVHRREAEIAASRGL